MADPMPDRMRLAIINAVVAHADDPMDIYSLANIIADAIWSATTWEQQFND